MNILFIENAANTNAGAFHSLIALIRHLRQKGINCFVAIPDRSNGKELLEQNNIPYITLRACSYTWMIPNNAPFSEVLKMPFKNLVVRLSSIKLKSYAKKNHIDVVHENTSACYIGYYVASALKIKHVWHIREFMEEDFDNRIWWRKRALKMINKSDAVIAISQAVWNKYSKDIDERKLYKINNGIEIKQFYLPTKKIFDSPLPNILCVGRVGKGKGQKVIIKALGYLKKQYSIQPSLIIAGSYTPDIYAEYTELAESLDVAEQINFVGQVRNISDLYSKSDILCMSSRCEAFGRVTVEAMLSGNLIIATNTGGSPEILENGKYGMLFESGDHIELAEKIRYAVTHKKEMCNLARAGQDHSKNNFSAQKNADEIEELYKRILL